MTNRGYTRRHPGPMLCLLVPLLAPAGPALADPPPWAPAHGYYKNRQKHSYKHRDRHHRPPYRRGPVLPWLAGGAAVGYVAGDRCNREALGAVLGGVIGGVTGSRIGDRHDRPAATIAGAIIGTLVGRSIGRYMDEVDQYCTGQALEYTPDNQPVEWQNPDAGASYRVVPTRTYQVGDGRYCREYISEATIGGRKQQVYGTACRQPDGSWKVVRQ